MEAKGAKRLGEEENGRSEILVWKKTNAQPGGASVVKVQASLVGLVAFDGRETGRAVGSGIADFLHKNFLQLVGYLIVVGRVAAQ